MREICVIFRTEDGVGVVSQGCRNCGDDQGASTYVDHLVNDRHMVVKKKERGVTFLVFDDAYGQPAMPDHVPRRVRFPRVETDPKPEAGSHE